MEELTVNLHMHTTYSDGQSSHAEIAEAALRTGLDVFIVTDHNILVGGLERYFQKNGKRVLMLVGEEVHDQTRDPQKNHLLVIGANRELSTFASDPQRLIDQVCQADGLSFIAHPIDLALPAFHEPDISWENWQVHNFTGIELWNGFSEFKSVVRTKMQAAFYAFFPQFMAHGPLPAALKKWDDLLARGQKVIAVGGSDAHALRKHLGPISRTIFPYEYHFRCINTHLLVPTSLSGDLLVDRRMVLDALRQGRAFIGYDFPESTKGFRFTANGKDKTVSIGEEIPLGNSVTLQIRLPAPVECRLVKDGKVIQIWNKRDICSYLANQPGIYRVECYIKFLGQDRGWIFSNPIYVRPNPPKKHR
jgi:Predicted metal-dependent phosphoesterases (PHP family)